MDKELRELIEKESGERIVSMPYGTGMIETVSGRRLFIKKGRRSRAYKCEANGLAELSKAKGVNVPGVVISGDYFIVSQWLESGSAGDDFYADLGRMTACLHMTTSGVFGFREDNFIGLNPQQNIPAGKESGDWALFYYNRRILPQFETARENGYGLELSAARIVKLESATSRLLEGFDEKPSLLHGDFWSGNYICSAGGVPYLIDPAVYYGDRETDIAMTLLFGGFPKKFYDAYDEIYPLREGWRERIPLYQLYHVLNHLNLFGAGYLPQALSIIDGL